MINNIQIELALKLSKQQILNKIAQWISLGSGWTIKSIDKHYLNIVKYQPMKGNSYIKQPKELQHRAKGLINLQNNDDKCFLKGTLSRTRMRRLFEFRLEKFSLTLSSLKC